jgi:hypothetical protein
MPKRSIRVSFWQLSLFGLLCLTAALGGLLVEVTRACEKSATEASSLLVGLNQTSRDADEHVRNFLGQARELLDGAAHDVRTSTGSTGGQPHRLRRDFLHVGDGRA